MPEYADIYSLHSTRDRATIELFLDGFMPARQEVTDEYGVPPFSPTPAVSFGSAAELLVYCCDHPQQEHGIYWRSIGGTRPEHGMVFFLQDGSMVLGLSTDSSDQDFVDSLCGHLGKMAGAVASYITHEDLPPGTAAEFIGLVRTLPMVDMGVDQTEIRAGRARRLSTLPLA